MPAESDNTKSALVNFGQNIVALMDDYKSLRDQLAEKEAQISSLTADLSAARSEAADHQAAHVELQGHIAELEAYRAAVVGEDASA